MAARVARLVLGDALGTPFGGMGDPMGQRWYHAKELWLGYLLYSFRYLGLFGNIRILSLSFYFYHFKFNNNFLFIFSPAFSSFNLCLTSKFYFKKRWILSLYKTCSLTAKRGR